ncbi:MAG: hemerythrin domain-containing protein [Proteobacteria bacterium]|nr:hemerythrin domain-containing protein [Pseudomonadota bacterium]
MSGLVHELKQDHVEVFALMESLRGVDIETRDAQQTIHLIRQMLSAHLKREETEFYPKLKVAARFDGRLKNILMLFAADMDVIAQTTLLFLAKYAHGGVQLDFAKELGRILATLRTRMNKEETILYDRYDQLVVAA